VTHDLKNQCDGQVAALSDLFVDKKSLLLNEEQQANN